jgi:hypothetical protein
MSDHPFEVGGRYRNRIGEYTVLSIKGDTMTVRYDDDCQQILNVEKQAWIVQSIQDEASPPTQPVRTKGESQAIQPVIDLVEEVLRSNFKAPFPADITDRVCLAIEANPKWLDRYNILTKQFESEDQSGEATVNQAIGYYSMYLTGMVTVKSGVKAKSGLIKSYSELAYPEHPVRD